MEAVKQPLQVVRELYAARGAPADGQDFGEKDHFAQILADPTIAAQASSEGLCLFECGDGARRHTR